MKRIFDHRSEAEERAITEELLSVMDRWGITATEGLALAEGIITATYRDLIRKNPQADATMLAIALPQHLQSRLLEIKECEAIK